MGRWSILLLALCLLLAGCGDQSKEELPPSEASQEVAPESSQPDLDISLPEPSASEPSLPETSKEILPSREDEISSPDREEVRSLRERESAQPDRKAHSEGEAPLGVLIEETDIDPEDNELTLGQEDAFQVLHDNLNRLVYVPDRYSLVCYGVDLVEEEPYYQIGILNRERPEAGSVGVYYVHGEDGGLYRLDTSSGTPYLVPIL